jgi:Holliday junction resolvase RusA-like endonuclease
LIITVYGEPAPQGSKRLLNKGNASRTAVIVDNSPGLAPWRSDVINAAKLALEDPFLPGYRHPPLLGPIIAKMVFSLRRPKTVKFSKRPYPTTFPDLSKLCRGTEDALRASGVIGDDSLIVEYTRLAKVYCGEDPEALETPGCYIVMMIKDVPEGIGK